MNYRHSDSYYTQLPLRLIDHCWVHSSTIEWYCPNSWGCIHTSSRRQKVDVRYLWRFLHISIFGVLSQWHIMIRSLRTRVKNLLFFHSKSSKMNSYRLWNNEIHQNPINVILKIIKAGNFWIAYKVKMSENGVQLIFLAGTPEIFGVLVDHKLRFGVMLIKNVDIMVVDL